MVTDAERLLDHQVEAAQDLDAKAEHMIKLGAATIAGALAIGVLVADNADLEADRWSAGLFAVGVLLNMLAAFFFVDSYLGFRTQGELHVAPDSHWLCAKRDDPSWNLEQHLGSLIGSYAGYSDYNVGRMTQSTLGRKHGLICLVIAAGFYVVALALIVVAVIV